MLCSPFAYFFSVKFTKFGLSEIKPFFPLQRQLLSSQVPQVVFWRQYLLYKKLKTKC